MLMYLATNELIHYEMLIDFCIAQISGRSKHFQIPILICWVISISTTLRLVQTLKDLMDPITLRIQSQFVYVFYNIVCLGGRAGTICTCFQENGIKLRHISMLCVVNIVISYIRVPCHLAIDHVVALCNWSQFWSAVSVRN